MSRAIRHGLSCILMVGVAQVAAAQDRYGTATLDSSGNAPIIYAPQPWMGNGSFGLGLSNALGGANCALVLSTAPTVTSYNNVQIYVDLQPASLVILTLLSTGGTPGIGGSGSAFLPIPLTFPPNPALAGLNTYAQWFIDEPFAPGFFSATQAMRLELTEPPLLFLGTSVGGSVDPYAFIDPATNTIVNNGGVTFTDNVTDAQFVHGGNELYVASSITSKVNRATLGAGTTPTWSNVYTGPGACYGLGYDWKRQILYTFTGPAAATRNLRGIDVDPSSATYGTEIAATTNLLAGVGGAERWAMSPSCNRIAVPTGVLAPGYLLLVDTDPSSATYMTAVVNTPIPTTGSLLAVSAGFGPDDQFVYVVLTGISGSSVVQYVAKYDVAGAAWIDFDPVTPGQQNLVCPVTNPARAIMSRNGGFMVIAGSGGIGRLDFSAVNPAGYTWTPWLVGSGLIASANGPSLNGDETRAAFTSTGPAKVIIVDTATGALAGNIALPTGFGNLYTTEWR